MSKSSIFSFEIAILHVLAGSLQIRGDLKQLSKVTYTRGTCDIQVGCLRSSCSSISIGRIKWACVGILPGAVFRQTLRSSQSS